MIRPPAQKWDSGAKVRCHLVGFYRNWQTDETTTDRLDKGISWPMGLLRLVSPIFPAHLLISPWPLYTYIFHLCIHGPAHAPDYRVGSHLFCIKRSEIKIAYNCVFDVRKYSRPCAAFATRFCVSRMRPVSCKRLVEHVGCNVNVHTIDCDQPRHVDDKNKATDLCSAYQLIWRRQQDRWRWHA